MGGAKLDEIVHGGNGFREESEAVFTDVKVAEANELCQRRRERGQLIVVEVEKVGEGGEVSEGLGQVGQVVVAEIEHAEILEGADLFWEFGERVVREDQGLEVSLLPDGIGDAAELLFPEIEAGRGRLGHGSMPACEHGSLRDSGDRELGEEAS